METHRLALPAGYRIENYEIQAVLGKGGFGITYAAYDWTLGRHMAIKELLPDTIATRIDGSTVVAMGPSHEESWQWARERFVEEARILAGFRHPNIIAAHRLIEANGTVYLVMDHLEGESYEARLRRIGREPEQASLMAVIGPLLDGLQEVHAAGLLHRDIKPENILFDKRGNPVLIDFGSARATVGATMTMTSIVTHGYSPAEQYQTKGKMGPWADIYAIAAVMCRAITGAKPPVASDRIMEDDFQWLSDRQLPGYSAAFLQAVDGALRVRPEERPKSIAEWATCFEGVPRANLIDRTEEPTGKPTRRVSGQRLELPPKMRTAVLSAMKVARKRSAPAWWVSWIKPALIVGIIGALFLIFHPWPHYQVASFQDNVSAYQGFVNRFPQSEYVSAARERIRVLQEEDVWRAAIAENGIASYRGYIRVYPDGKHLDAAKQRTTELADGIWKGISGTRSEAEVTKFLKEYPETSKQADAEARIQFLYNDWAWVKEQDKIPHYQRFLARNPTHPQRAWTEKRIIDLEVDAIAAGEHGELPKAKAVGGATATGPASVEIENGTGYELTVRYSGGESKKAVIPAQGRETFNLPTGSYRVAASVNAARVNNYYGKDDFSGGRYEIRFYIQSR